MERRFKCSNLFLIIFVLCDEYASFVRACIGGGGSGAACCPPATPVCAPAVPICSSSSYAVSGSYAAPLHYPRPLAYVPASSGCSEGGGCVVGCCGSSSSQQKNTFSSSSSSSSFYTGGSYAAVSAPGQVGYQGGSSYQALPFAPLPIAYSPPPPPPIHIATPQSGYLAPPPAAIPPPPPPPPPSVVGVISAPASPDSSNVEGVDSPYDELNQEHETETTTAQPQPPAPSGQPEPPAMVAPEPLSPPATVVEPAPPGPIDSTYGGEAAPPSTLEVAVPPAPAPVAQTPYGSGSPDASVVAAPGTAVTRGHADYGDEINSAQIEDANTGLNCDDSDLKSIVEKALKSSSDNLDAARKIESEAAARFGGRFNSIVSDSEFAYVNWYGKRNCQLMVNNRHSLTWED